MELRHIRYFKAVAEEKSFTRAAEKMAIAQPPLSRQIQDLEAELGAALFLRSPHKVELTPEGELFLQYASQIEPLRGGCAGAEGRTAGHDLHRIGGGLWTPAVCGMDCLLSGEASPCAVQSLEWKYR